MIPAIAGRLVASAAVRGGSSGLSDVNFDIEIKARGTERYLKKVRRQIPFAISSGLTDTAEDIRDAEVKHLLAVFDVRGNWWKENRRYGLRYKAARKTKPVAEVYTRAHWLFDHVHGGTRSESGKRRGVPKSASIRRTQTGSIRMSDRPLRIPKSYKIPISGGKSLLLRRKQGGMDPELMYLLIPRARIKKRFYFYETAHRTARKVGQKNFDKALDRAIRTAK